MEAFDDTRNNVFLAPGEHHFGDRGTLIRTLLGSCVSITLWHPVLRIGGMCHYLLPERRRVPADPPSGAYANEALELLFDEVRRRGTQPAEYEAKIFGGARMYILPSGDRALDIGARNVEAGRQLLLRHDCRLHAEHHSGFGHRSLIFDVESGKVWLKHQPGPIELFGRLPTPKQRKAERRGMS